MSDHYKLVKELLEHSDDVEIKRLSEYIDKMHLKCLKKTTSSCNVPCTIQTTKRGNFCVYKDGNIHDLDKDMLKRITSLSKKKICTSLFIRLEPTIDSKINVIIYIPSLITDNISFNSYLLDTLNNKFNVERGTITGIGAILRERPLRRHINIDLNTGNDVYTILKFTVNFTEVTVIDRFLLKTDIIETLKIWASRFEFTFEEENVEIVKRFGALIQLKVCKKFDNFKATSKLAA